MRKPSLPTLKLSMLSYAIALATNGGVAQALPVDLCSGQSSVTISTLNPSTPCNVDVAGAAVTVAADGSLENGVAAAADAVTVNNAGLISRQASGANTAEATALHLDRSATAALVNSGRIDGVASAYATYVGSASSDSSSSTSDSSVPSTDTTTSESTPVVNGVSSSAASSSAIAYAAGIGIDGDLATSLVNSGHIGAQATANADMYGDSEYSRADARAAGIDISGSLVDAGSFANSGDIQAEADAGASGGWYSSDASASATGVSIGGDATAFGNNGSIMAHAYATSGDIGSEYGSADATGVYIDGDVSGEFSNDEDIGAFAAGDNAYAYGVDLDYAASLKNRGNIAAEADGRDASATALALNDGGSVFNRGNLGAQASGWSASADGLSVEDVDSLQNAGSIQAQAWMASDGDYYPGSGYTDSGYYRAGSARGVDAEWAGSFSNSGSISAAAWQDGGYGYGYGEVGAYGVNIEEGGQLHNSGSIQAQAEGYYADAYGLNAGWVDAIENSGKVDAMSGASGNAHAVGIAAGSVESFDNSGAISAGAVSYGYSSDYSAYAAAYGARVDSLGSALANSGSIEARASNYNDGSVMAVALGVSGAAPFPFFAASADTGSSGVAQVDNSGLLSARADSYDGDARAVGLQIGSELGDIGGPQVLDMPGGSGNLAVGNSGRIEATAGSEYGAAYAGGIAGNWLSNVTLQNKAGGDIAATASGEYDVQAGGIAAYVLDNSQIGNDGRISASVAASDGIDGIAGINGIDGEYAVQAAGIYVAGALVNGSGIANNAGADISATATGWYNADARGISVGHIAEGGSIANAGHIGATASAQSSQADATGIAAEELLGGRIANSGTIDVQALSTDSEESDAYVYARGIGAGSLNDVFSTDAFSTAAFSTAGDVVTGEVKAGIANSGVINVTADSAYDEAAAYGMEIGSISDAATVSNDKGGVINVQAASGWSSAEAYGMSVDEMAGSASLANSGTIAAHATAVSSSADAFGMYAGSLAGVAQVGNSGTIVALADTSGSSSAEAFGLYAGSLNDGSRVSNSGLVTATARQGDSIDGSAYAYGLYVDNAESGSAVISNSNTLIADAKADGVASAYGIYVSGWLGEGARVENSGDIYASGNAKGESYSIYVGNGDGSVVNSGRLMSGVWLGSSYEKDDVFAYDVSGNGVSLVNAGTVVNRAGTTSFVGGNYTQQAGGALTFAVTDADHYGRIVVAGTADFRASNVLNVQVDPAQRLKNGDVLYNVIASDELLAPAFKVGDDSAFWNFDAAIDGSYVDLVAHYVDAQNAVQATGLKLSSSFAGLANTVIGAGLDGRYAALATALEAAPTAQAAADVLEHVTPVITAGAAQATRAAGEGASNAIAAHIADVRGASSGDDVRDGAIWVKPFVGKISQDDADGVSGYDADSNGVVVGSDAAISPSWRVGVALATAQSDVSARISGVDIDTTQFTLYGSYAIDERTALDLSAGYGLHSYDGRRQTIGNATARSAFDGSQLSAGLDLSRRYALGQHAALIPSFTLRYHQVNLDAYAETGAGLYNLAVQDSSDDSLLAAAKGSYELGLGSHGVFSASLGVGFDSADTATATAALDSGTGPTFVTNGIEPDSTLLTGGLGYRYVTGQHLEIEAAYDVESRSGFLGQSASLKFKLPF